MGGWRRGGWQFCWSASSPASSPPPPQLGRFERVARPGFTCLLWPLQYFAGAPVSLRVSQVDIRVTSKTSDDVFVDVHVSVQYSVDEASAYNAFYRLSNPVQQLTAYVCDTVRSTVPKLTLADVFIRKDVIAQAVRDELTKQIGSWGYTLLGALVTDISPETQVRNAMNEIQAQQRLRQAAKEKAEANKILAVTAASADAESKFLQGQGIARQRQAIIEGLRESVISFGDTVSGINSKDVLNLMLMTQWLDTLHAVGANAKSNAVFLPSSPAAFGDLSAQITQAVLASGAAAPQVTPMSRE